MNKQDFTLSELMNELITTESILETKVSVNIAKASSSKLKDKRRRRRRRRRSGLNKLADRFKKAENGTKGKKGSNCNDPDFNLAINEF
jgi:hypothetical protein